MAAKRQPNLVFTVSWRWSDDSPKQALKVDEVEATNVQRAINKLIKTLEDDYTDVKRRLYVISVVPTD